jgi:hypothetical protein
MAEVTVKKLNAGATADTITDYLGCITDGSGYIPVEKRGTGGDENRLTNAPVVYMPETASPPQAIAATYPVLGRATDYNWAIAPSRPLVQCFAKKDGQWSLIGEFGGEYESQFLSMYPLNSPVPGETWALLSGRHIGDTGGRLLLEVVACDGKTFTKKWSRDEIRWGKVDVSGSTVVLTYEKLDEKGRVVFSQEDPIRYTEVLHVTPKGLE